MQSNYNGPFSKDKEWGGIYFCVQNNSFVHEEESTAEFSFMYYGIYSILITYEYDLKYWLDQINTRTGNLLMGKTDLHFSEELKLLRIIKAG